MKQKLIEYYFIFFGFLAKKYIKRHTPFIIWITGSIWKTSARMIIQETLQYVLKQKVIYTSNKNFNGELWMSLSILWISDYSPNIISVLKTIFQAVKMSFFWKKIYDIIVLEYWIDHVWEMDFLLSIVQPHIWIITKIDCVHSSQFETKEIIAKEKYTLLQQSSEIVYLNNDDEFAGSYYDTIATKKYFYTTHQEDNNSNIDLKWWNYTFLYENNQIQTCFDFYLHHKKQLTISSPLIGEENIWYISLWLHISDFLLQKYYNTSFFIKENEKIHIDFTLQYSRLSMFSWIHKSILMDSTYNAAPKSMKQVIDNFIKLHTLLFPKHKIMFCLGEMRELWQYSQEEHEKLAKYTQNMTQNIFIVWESMKKYFLPMAPKSLYFQNSQLLWKHLKDFLWDSKEKYLILFKWSQNTIFMEEALVMVLKDHQDMEKICRQEPYWKEKKKKFFLSSHV